LKRFWTDAPGLSPYSSSLSIMAVAHLPFKGRFAAIAE